MAQEEEITSKAPHTSRNRNNNRGCTKKKCLVVAFFLVVFAALIAFYIALVCQHMELFVVDATISAFNVTAHHSNASVPSPHNTSAPRRRTISASVDASAPQPHGATSSPKASTPRLHTASAKDSSFYLSEVALTLSLLFKNPTPSMGTYHYHQLNWQILYHSITIANGSVHSFSQGPHHAHLPIKLHLKGANIALPNAIASALQKNGTVLKLKASTSAYVQLLGKFIDYEFPVYCNLTFPHPRDGKAHLHSKTTCIVKAG